MIVQCEGCKTRFRIADDKVSERGVRVRCTRCKETFLVRPEDAQKPKDEPAPAAASAPAMPEPPKEVSVASELGLDLDGLLGEDFDLDLPPPPDEDGDASASGSADASEAGGGWTVERDDDAADAEPSTADLFGGFDDPPASDDAGESGEPEQPAHLAGLIQGKGAHPDAPAPTEEDVDAAMAAFDVAFNGGTEDGEDASAVAGPTGSEAGPTSAEADATVEPSPATVEATSAPDPLPDADPFPGWGAPEADPKPPAEGEPAASWGTPEPADDGDAREDSGSWTLDMADSGPGAAASDVGEAAPALTDAAGAGDGNVPGLGDGDMPGFDLGGPPGLDAPAVALGGQADPGPGAMDAGAGNLAMDLGGDDPFASLDVGGDPADAFADQGDAPAWPPGEPAPPAENAAPAGAPLARLDLKAAGSDDAAAAPDATKAKEEKKAAPKRKVAVAPFLANGVFAAGIIAVALGAFVTLRTPGPLDATVLSPDRMRQAFAGRSGQGVLVTEVVSGVYTTRRGDALLYVRGEIVNSGDAESSAIGVQARVVDRDGAVLQTASGIVGAVPSSEDLWRIEDPAGLPGLFGRLLQDGPTSVESGGRAPFFVAFDQIPDDLFSVRFEVEVTEGEGATAIALPDPAPPDAEEDAEGTP
jgi:predicted Zn finger-like uncharacterized protein